MHKLFSGKSVLGVTKKIEVRSVNFFLKLFFEAKLDILI